MPSSPTLRSLTRIPDRAALYAATDHHPWVRRTTDPIGGAAHDGTALAGPDLVVWYGGPGSRRLVSALGAGPAALDAVVALHEAGVLGSGTRAELPRMDHAVVASAFPGVPLVDWDLRWLSSTPPVLDGEPSVEPLASPDHDEINDVLDAALPEALHRPGSRRARQWYGIRHESRLIAVACDSSTPGFGFLNSIAVRPECRGRGLGAVITSRIAREQQAEHGTVMLGVYADNVIASRLYERIGFTGLHQVTAFTLP